MTELIEHMAQIINGQLETIDELKAERDAARRDIEFLGNSEYALMCDICAVNKEECGGAMGEGVCQFKWRGDRETEEDAG